MKFINFALDLLFPPTCGICGKIGEGYICKKCYQELQIYIYQKIENNNFYLLRYKGIIRDKMIAYKFNEKAYLHNLFCEIFVKNKIGCKFLKSYDIMIPVPMHKKKRAKRGYNQSELIARNLANYFKIPIDTKVLIKQVNTPMQSSLGKEERAKNVQNVYKVQNEEKIKDKNVLLVDDIYTTGATVKECKKIVKLAGAKKVGVIIIAKD